MPVFSGTLTERSVHALTVLASFPDLPFFPFIRVPAESRFARASVIFEKGVGVCVEDGRVGVWGVSRGERGGIECCYWRSNRISMYGFYLLLFPVQKMAGDTFPVCSASRGTVGMCSVSRGTVGECSVSRGTVGMCSVGRGTVGMCSVGRGTVGMCSVSRGAVGMCSVSLGTVGMCSVSLGTVGGCVLSVVVPWVCVLFSRGTVGMCSVSRGTVGGCVQSVVVSWVCALSVVVPWVGVFCQSWYRGWVPFILLIA